MITLIFRLSNLRIHLLMREKMFYSICHENWLLKLNIIILLININ